MALSTCCLVDTSKSIDAAQARTLCGLRCEAAATVKFGSRNLAGDRVFALAWLYVYCYTSMERQRVEGLRGAVSESRDLRPQWVY